MTSSPLKISPDTLDAEAKALEAEAVALERQKKPIAAQGKLQQAKSKRDQAFILRHQMSGNFDRLQRPALALLRRTAQMYHHKHTASVST